MMIAALAARESLNRIACRSRVALYMSSPPPAMLPKKPRMMNGARNQPGDSCTNPVTSGVATLLNESVAQAPMRYASALPPNMPAASAMKIFRGEAFCGMRRA